MVMGGDGRRAVTVMWALTIVTFVFVVLRTYTRLVVVKLFGIDDQVYILAFVYSTPFRFSLPFALFILLTRLWLL